MPMPPYIFTSKNKKKICLPLGDLDFVKQKINSSIKSPENIFLKNGEKITLKEQEELLKLIPDLYLTKPYKNNS